MTVNLKGLVLTDDNGEIRVTHFNGTRIAVPISVDVDNISDLIAIQGVNEKGEICDNMVKLSVKDGDGSGIMFKQFLSGDVEIVLHISKDDHVVRKFHSFQICE